MLLDLSNNPKTREVYSLMFIVDMEKKKKSINLKSKQKQQKVFLGGGTAVLRANFANRYAARNSACTGLQQQAAAVNSSVAVLAASTTAELQQIKWQPPASGRLKCNVDATFSIPHNRIGVGICLRDDEGTFVLAKIVNFEGVYSVEVGEALGLFHAIQWLSDMQMDNIDFEVDSKIRKDAFTARRDDISEFGHIVEASRSMFHSEEATLLASAVVYYAIPNCIESSIINEML
ncbi:hypothetical protein MTR_6g089560 [Medicago truncatula]|uniref:RNase H type-1 domain-containing protein n=1 Tax=Medicago truncatula TaxID=3880 RepID=G7KQF4_MEDTR|nr:hypothetical protein MTR_6g089560 [Medicago truncatula]